MTTKATITNERLGRNPFAEAKVAEPKSDVTSVESAENNEASPREIARALLVDIPVGLTLNWVRIALEARAQRRKRS